MYVIENKNFKTFVRLIEVINAYGSFTVCKDLDTKCNFYARDLNGGLDEKKLYFIRIEQKVGDDINWIKESILL